MLGKSLFSRWCFLFFVLVFLLAYLKESSTIHFNFKTTNNKSWRCCQLSLISLRNLVVYHLLLGLGENGELLPSLVSIAENLNGSIFLPFFPCVDKFCWFSEKMVLLHPRSTCRILRKVFSPCKSFHGRAYLLYN